jgi:hypothetical protein
MTITILRSLPKLTTHRRHRQRHHLWEAPRRVRISLLYDCSFGAYILLHSYPQYALPPFRLLQHAHRLRISSASLMTFNPHSIPFELKRVCRLLRTKPNVRFQFCPLAFATHTRLSYTSAPSTAICCIPHPIYHSLHITSCSPFVFLACILSCFPYTVFTDR